MADYGGSPGQGTAEVDKMRRSGCDTGPWPQALTFIRSRYAFGKQAYTNPKTPIAYAATVSKAKYLAVEPYQKDDPGIARNGRGQRHRAYNETNHWLLAKGERTATASGGKTMEVGSAKNID